MFCRLKFLLLYMRLLDVVRSSCQGVAHQHSWCYGS